MLVNRLKQWTGLANATIIFDSDTDVFTEDALFLNVQGRGNIAIVAATSDGDVFGGYYTVPVTEQWQAFRDPNIFLFSFKSHGRCPTPQRFPLKPGKRRRNAFVKYFVDSTDWWFVAFGAGGADCVSFGDENSFTWCNNLSKCFDGLENTTLTGVNGKNNPHLCTRILAVHLW